MYEKLDKRKHYTDNAVMDNVVLYTTNKYTAYIHPRSIVICTNLQCFRITFERYNMDDRLETVKHALLNNELNDISDIINMTNKMLKVNSCDKPSVLV